MQCQKDPGSGEQPQIRQAQCRWRSSIETADVVEALKRIEDLLRRWRFRLDALREDVRAPREPVWEP